MSLVLLNCMGSSRTVEGTNESALKVRRGGEHQEEEHVPVSCFLWMGGVPTALDLSLLFSRRLFHFNG